MKPDVVVDVGNSRFRTCLELTAEGRVFARHRARDSDRDFRLSERWCSETKASSHNSKCCQDYTHYNCPFN